MLVAPPGTAYAHGEEALFFPVGILCALPFIGLIAWLVVRGWVARVTVVALAIVIAIAVGFLPGPFFPDCFRYTAEGNFVAGLAPPLVVEIVLALVFQRFAA